jgi:hypothetical protein
MGKQLPEITVNAAVNFGTVSSGDETVCNGGDPANITLSTAPSGGAGTFTYQWYYQDGLVGCPTGTSTYRMDSDRRSGTVAAAV